MARIRTVKPSFFASESVAELSFRARLTWIGLWTHSDDWGRCKDNVRLIKAAAWPLDDVSLRDVEDDLVELAKRRRILRYRVDGRAFIQITNWGEHQKINRPSESDIPAPPNDDRDPSGMPHGGLSEDSRSAHGGRTEGSNGGPAGLENGGFTEGSVSDPGADWEMISDGQSAQVIPLTEDSLNPHGALTEDSPPERKGKEGKGKEENPACLPSNVSPDRARRSHGGQAGHPTEHPTAAELNATATRHGGFAIVARWALSNPGITTAQRRALAKAVDNLIAQRADPELVPAALDEAHRPEWRDPVRSLPSAYDRVRRDAHPPPAAPERPTRDRMPTTKARVGSAQALKRPEAS